MNFPPLLRLRPNDPAYKHLILRDFEGTYKSNWYFLIQATRSSLIQAATNTSKLVDIYERAVSRKQRRVETLLVMNLNYPTHLAGPLLGTVLSASAALETFLRMSMRAFLEQNIPKRERGKGTSSMVAKKLAEFDELNAPSKLEQAYRTLLRRQVPQETIDDFRDLATFRNNCFHGDPVVILSTGRDQTTRGKRIREVAFRKRYPFLWDGNRPLSLSHALQAVRLHDAVVRDLFVGRSPKLYVHSDLHDEHPESNLIQNGLPKTLSPAVFDQLAAAWDNSVEQELSAVPDDEQRELLLELQRKATLRSVK